VIVLGVDPSLCNTGIAAMRLSAVATTIVETSVVRTEPSAKKHRIHVGDDNARRVVEITRALDAAIKKHGPVALVMERPAGSKGAKAATALARAETVVEVVAALHGLPLIAVQPLDVKRAMVGRKTADKDEIIAAVESRYPEVAWTGPQSTWEHQADAVGAVVAALDSETLRSVQTMARRLSA
jgi:Holliday junction resolvasome RuvABC endonuclease subunit